MYLRQEFIKYLTKKWGFLGFTKILKSDYLRHCSLLFRCGSLLFMQTVGCEIVWKSFQLTSRLSQVQRYIMSVVW